MFYCAYRGTDDGGAFTAQAGAIQTNYKWVCLIRPTNHTGAGRKLGHAGAVLSHAKLCLYDDLEGAVEDHRHVMEHLGTYE